MPELTKNFVSKLKVPPGKRDVLVFDSDHKNAVAGFGVRKFASGKSYFFIKYSVGNRQRRQSLKEVVDGNIQSMRKLAAEVKARASVLGQDLIAERKAAREKPASVPLGQAVPIYLAARQPKLRPRTYGEFKRYLETSWSPLHKCQLDAITREDIVGVLDDIEHNSGGVSADRAKVALSGLFSWGMDEGFGKDKNGRRLRLSATPTLHIKNRAEAASRTRVLSEEELAEIWRSCLEDDHGRIIQLLILTAQRRSEIADLAWREINKTEAQIELPARRVKNDRDHVVPLSSEALSIIDAVPRREERELLFGSASGGYGGWSKSKVELDARINAARADRGEKHIARWTLHDLRRSTVTHLVKPRQRQGKKPGQVEVYSFAEPHVVEMLINHVSGHKGGVSGIYNRSTYFAAQRQAVELWGEHIVALVSGRKSEIVPLSAPDL